MKANMKRSFYAVIFLLTLTVLWGMPHIDTQAAIKEYTLERRVSRYMDDIDLGEVIPLLWDFDPGKAANIFSSDASVASFNEYLNIEPLRVGSCDLSFDYEGDTYVIHFIGKAKKLKTQTIKLFLLKKNQVIDCRNLDLYLNSIDEFDEIKYSENGIVKLSRRRLTLKKTGKVTISYKGVDDNRYVEGEFNVEVGSLSDARKAALIKAKTFLAKKPKNAKFSYVDLNFDGVKDLIVDGQFYIFSEDMSLKKYDDKYDTTYISKSKKRKMRVKKVSKKFAKEIGGDTVYVIESANGGYEDYFVKVSPYTKKHTRIKTDFARVSWFDGDAFMLLPMSKSKFNAAIKKYMPGKKAVKTYTNSAKNRKKLLK